MIIKELITQVSKTLKDAGVPNARLDAEVLVMAACNITRAQLYPQLNDRVSNKCRTKLDDFIKRRLTREPIQYILGESEFWSTRFLITKDVLIPRPESETLIEIALTKFREKNRTPKTILDLGTGSGILAITLARIFNQARVAAIDISEKALGCASKNAQILGCQDRIHFHLGNLYEALPENDQKFDLIVANLPYIPTCELTTLQPEIREFEPARALDGGPEGLDFIQLAISRLPCHLNLNGLAIFEVGHKQASKVLSLLEKMPLQIQASAHQDLSGIERVVVLELSSLD